MKKKMKNQKIIISKIVKMITNLLNNDSSNIQGNTIESINK